MKKLRFILLWCFILATGYTFGQRIKSAEYFFDVDPGINKGKAITFTNNLDSINMSDSLLTTGLGLGFHNLFLRVKDSLGNWSLYEGRSFLVDNFISPTVTFNNTKAEYFFDNDPGIGKAKPISISSTADTVVVSDSIPTTGLKSGFHGLFLRVQNSLGNWSLYEGRNFLIDSVPSVGVTFKNPKAEYFFDNDPGIGKAKPISITATADTITVNDSLPTTGLKAGFHGLFLRVQNSLGIWSLYEGRNFLIDSTSTAAITFKNANAEYFYDTDPGIGNGTQVSVSSSADTIVVNDSFPTTGLKAGFHALFIRVQNSTGKWSLYEGRNFLIDAVITLATNTIVGAEYYYDTDPGIGKGTSIPSFTPADSVNVFSQLSISSLSSGSHYLYIRAKDQTNAWSLTAAAKFFICSSALPAPIISGITNYCDGDDISLAGSTVTGATKYLWHGPKGFTDTTLNIKISGADSTNSGIYSLIAIRSGGTACDTSNIANDTIKVFPAAVALVATNQSVCIGSSASIGASTRNGLSYSWSSAPTGFTSTLANPAVSPTVTTTYTLVVTNANSCSNTNSVVIGINSLPQANVAANSTVCSNSALYIGSSGASGDSYTWSSVPVGFSSNLSNPTVSPTVTSTYTLVETNASGCSNTNSVVITTNSLPLATVAANSTVCSATSLSIGYSGASGDAYSWSSSPAGFSSTLANPTVSPTSTTTYMLTETNTNGCSNSNSVVITTSSLPLATVIASKTVCNSASLSIGSAGASGDSYSWTSTPAGFSSTLANPTVSPTITTTYMLTETNASSCSNTNSVTITVSPAPLAVVIPNASVCSGQPLSIGGSTTIGSSYSWISSPLGFISTLSNPIVKPTITTTFTLTETNAGGCSKSNSVAITVKPLPDAHWTLNYFGITTYLHADDSTLTDTSYHWSYGDGNNTTGHMAKHIYPNNKSYDITLAVSGANGCANSFDSTLNITVSGVEPMDNDIDKLIIYPNPFQTSVIVQYDLIKTSDMQIAVYDLAGKEVAKIAMLNQAPGQKEIEIDANKYNFMPGVYLLKLITAQGIITKQIVKL